MSVSKATISRGVLEKIFGKKQVALALKQTKIKAGQRRPIVKLALDVPDLDKLGPYDVIVMIYVSQWCDTDVDMGTHDGHGATTIGFKKLILVGHEGCGVVLAVGKKVTSVKPGDWVSVKVRTGGYGINCINCRAGMPERCLHWNGKRNGQTAKDRRFDIRENGIFKKRGTFSQFLQLTEDEVIPAPWGIPAQMVAHGEPGGVLVAGVLRGMETWWGDNDWLEKTEEGPGSVGVIGAGGLSAAAACAFSELPGAINDAIADGALPYNFFCRPMAEQRRAQAGLPPKRLDPLEVVYFARSAKENAGFKARVPGELGIKYVGFQDVGLDPVICDTGLVDAAGTPITTGVYNTSALCDQFEKGKADWIVELCGNPLQAMALALPVDKKAKFGGMAASGSRICWTSITGGEETFSGFPAAKLLWGATMNNIEIEGLVNYPREATLLFFYALKRARARVSGWGDNLQEKLVEPDEFLGTDAMYEMKRASSGKIGAIMNSLSEIERVCDELGVPFSTNDD